MVWASYAYFGNMKQNAHHTLLKAFPLFVKTSHQKVVVVGNGDEAVQKARLVAQTDAEIAIIADAPDAELLAFSKQYQITLIQEQFSPEHLHNARFVYAASGDAEIDAAIVKAANHAGILVNAVDQPEICDFLTPSMVNRAPVLVAIGTEGTGPVLGQMIRKKIDQMLVPSLGHVAQMAVGYRKAVDVLLPKGKARRAYWKTFFEGAVAKAVEAKDFSLARRTATKALKTFQDKKGHVSLVGAGPGAEDLLTLRAQRLLMEADVIVHDALVPQAVIDMGRRDAERIPAGKRKGCHSKSQKEINALLVTLGQEGKQVVRLKAGDPLVYGRAGEEMQALRDAGITFDIVPGITAALAAAADFELPLTLRGVASSLIFTTGHDLNGTIPNDIAKLAVSGASIAVYMGKTVAAGLTEQLRALGISEDTGVAVVEHAGQPRRRMLYGTLRDLPKLTQIDGLDGPTMVMIGDAVAAANLDHAEALHAAPLPLNPQLEFAR